MEIGESWAYRARGMDPLVEVRVVRFGTARPARVLVRFLADESEGREEWVPPARLKVQWSNLDAFVLSEKRWQAVAATSPDHDGPEWWAAETVFDELIPYEVAATGMSAASGITTIHDVVALTTLTGFSSTELRSDPLAFEEGGDLVVPWAVTLLIAQRAAARNPDPVLRKVEKDEAAMLRKKTYGGLAYEGVSRPRDEDYQDAQFFAEQDERPFYRPRRELLREWCGMEAASRRDELRELRREVHRLGRLAQEAIGELRAAGQAERAARLERDLGVTVEELRRRR